MPPLNKNCPSEGYLAKCVPVREHHIKSIKIIMLGFFINVDQKELSHKIGKHRLVFRQGFAASQNFGSINIHFLATHLTMND